MLSAHLEDPGFDVRRHLVRAGVRTWTVLDQATEAVGCIAPQPRVHRLAPDLIAAGHVGHARSVIEHLEHGLIPLFHETKLHQHDAHLRGRPIGQLWEFDARCVA